MYKAQRGTQKRSNRACWESVGRRGLSRKTPAAACQRDAPQLAVPRWGRSRDPRIWGRRRKRSPWEPRDSHRSGPGGESFSPGYSGCEEGREGGGKRGSGCSEGLWNRQAPSPWADLPLILVRPGASGSPHLIRQHLAKSSPMSLRHLEEGKQAKVNGALRYPCQASVIRGCAPEGCRPGASVDVSIRMNAIPKGFHNSTGLIYNNTLKNRYMHIIFHSTC